MIDSVNKKVNSVNKTKYSVDKMCKIKHCTGKIGWNGCMYNNYAWKKLKIMNVNTQYKITYYIYTKKKKTLCLCVYVFAR